LLRICEELPRTARDLAQGLGKRVELECVGAELELDRSILDRLADPLLHLVRNAVAHGIEPPALRREADKGATGRIRIEAQRDRDDVWLEVSDDGAGIDADAVREKAVAGGLLLADLAEDLPPEELVQLVFRPGLSTAASVSSLAGRGVGMDAVRSAVEALGGRVRLESRAGEGTRVRLRLPLSAAVQRVLVAGLGEERVALPIARVERVVEVEAAAIAEAGQEAFVELDGAPLPMLDLARTLALPAVERPARALLLLTRLDDQPTALRVDRLLGRLDAYVKPVPSLLSGVRALAGVTSDEDGHPVFLIEPGRLR